jgi:ribosomal protein S18 acetylase RimI-like enzyme
VAFVLIRALGEADAEAYVALRAEALVDSPLSFASAPGDDVASDVDFVRERLRERSGDAIFGAFDGALVGSVNAMRDGHLKSAHKLNVFGMYVMPTHRQRGTGAMLIAAVIEHARELSGVEWIHLSVSSSAVEALRLYRAAGFEIWGTELDALRHDGRTVDEHHMALRL